MTSKLRAENSTGFRSKKLLGLALTAALASIGSVTVANADCVLRSLDTLPPLRVAETVGHGADWKLLQKIDADTVGVTASCSDGYLSELKLRLKPGEQRLIHLVAEGGVLMPLNVGIEEGNARASGEWQILFTALGVDENGELGPRDVVDEEPRPTQLVQIEILAGASNQPGQRQSMRLGGSTTSGSDGVLLTMEDGREEGLFRDQFRIDPTLGQFSQRSRARIGPEAEPAAASGSSSR